MPETRVPDMEAHPAVETGVNPWAQVGTGAGAVAGASRSQPGIDDCRGRGILRAAGTDDGPLRGRDSETVTHHQEEIGGAPQVAVAALPATGNDAAPVWQLAAAAAGCPQPQLALGAVPLPPAGDAQLQAGNYASVSQSSLHLEDCEFAVREGRVGWEKRPSVCRNAS